MVVNLLGMASPAGRRGRLSVLVLHRVLPATDPLYVETMDAPRFDTMCRWVKSLFNVLPLDSAVQRLRTGTLPSRALAITFDDGYADNLQHAAPILGRHGLSATFFITTGLLGGGCMWNDTVIEAVRRCRHARLDLRDLLEGQVEAFELRDASQRRIAIDTILGKIKYLGTSDRARVVNEIAERCGAALPTDLMLTPEQVVELRRSGMQIGAHTVSHPILARTDAPLARQEMADSKRHLEDLIGERVGLFAYPNGKPREDYTAATVALAREIGFDAAVTTAQGAAHGATDPFEIPRFTPWDQSRLRFGARMAKNLWASRAAARR